jgi:hypothetical protein
MIGISIRLGLSLGLHLRNENPSISIMNKEMLARTWWSLRSIEFLLSSITGRPCVVAQEDCSVDLPQPLAEKSHKSTSSLEGSVRSSSTILDHASSSSNRRRQHGTSCSYAVGHVKVGLITQKALACLYTPRTASKSWEHVQNSINECIEDLEEWKRIFLPEENGLRVNPYTSATSARDWLLMQFSYYSTMILITRPCLCRTERRIRGQSESSADFNQRVAEQCVQAAQDMTNLLSDTPDPVSLFEDGPW